MRKVEPYGLQHRRLERDAVHDRAHRVLADAEGDVAPGVGRGEDARALELGLRRLDEVGGAADHRRRERLERLHHLARRRRGSRRPRPRGNTGSASRQPSRGSPRRSSSRSARERRGTPRPGGEPRLPLALRLAPRSATTAMCSRTSSETANVASGSKPERLLRRPHLVLAERGAVRLGGVAACGAG